MPGYHECQSGGLTEKFCLYLCIKKMRENMTVIERDFMDRVIKFLPRLTEEIASLTKEIKELKEEIKELKKNKE